MARVCTPAQSSGKEVWEFRVRNSHMGVSQLLMHLLCASINLNWAPVFKMLRLRKYMKSWEIVP